MMGVKGASEKKKWEEKKWCIGKRGHTEFITF